MSDTYKFPDKFELIQLAEEITSSLYMPVSISVLPDSDGNNSNNFQLIDVLNNEILNVSESEIKEILKNHKPVLPKSEKDLQNEKIAFEKAITIAESKVAAGDTNGALSDLLVLIRRNNI